MASYDCSNSETFLIGMLSEFLVEPLFYNPVAALSGREQVFLVERQRERERERGGNKKLSGLSLSLSDCWVLDSVACLK